MPDPTIPLLNSTGGTLTCRRGDPDPEHVTLEVRFGGGTHKTGVMSFAQLNRLTAHGARTVGRGVSAFRRKTTRRGDKPIVELSFDGPADDMALVDLAEFVQAAFVILGYGEK